MLLWSVPITAIDGRPLAISPLTLKIHEHTKSLKFYVTKITSPPIILSHPWLVTHNPLISLTPHRTIHLSG